MEKWRRLGGTLRGTLRYGDVIYTAPNGAGNPASVLSDQIPLRGPHLTEHPQGALYHFLRFRVKRELLSCVGVAYRQLLGHFIRSFT